MWPKHKLWQVRPGKGKPPDLQVQLQTNNQLHQLSLCLSWCWQTRGPCTGQELPETLTSVERHYKGQDGPKWWPLSSLHCWVGYIPGHSKPAESPLVSTAPQGRAFDGHASKKRSCENGKSALVKKEGGSGGEGFKYVVLHLGLLSKCALFNSQTKHRESIQIREKTLLLRVCKISFLPIALLWQNLQRPVCSQWGFFPQLQILPKLSNLFLSQENLLVSHLNFFLINGLPSNCLCCKSNSGKTDDSAHS